MVKSHSLKENLQDLLRCVASGDKNLIKPRSYDYSTDYLTLDDSNMIYSSISKVFGERNALLIGGTAMQRYSQHRPKDIDIIINGNVADNIGKLQDQGFYNIKKYSFKPFFKSDIYYMYYGTGVKFLVELYSTHGLLERNESFEEIMEKAKFNEYMGGKVYYADPHTLAVLKYRSWKNRFFNGRADKDLLDLKEMGVDSHIDELPEEVKSGLESAYKFQFISRVKSIASEIIHVLHNEYA
jgi:hypothetical protein